MAKDFLRDVGLEYETPIAMLTIGQLVEVLRRMQPQQTPSKPKEYIYGLRGIMYLFGVSHKTAQQYKNTFLAPACDQVGKTIIIDRDKAVELFEQTGRKLDAYGL